MPADKQSAEATVSDNRYRMRINVDITQEGRGDFMKNDLTYSNLKYEDVVLLESLLIKLLSDLNEYAKVKAANQ